MTTMAVRSARNGKVVLSSWLINKSNNNKKSAIFWRAASSSSIPKIDGDKDKKIREEERRLSAVIDAVNDRKLPPELRGQRNSVRSETDIINVVEQRIWHSMEEGQFENLPGRGKPLNLSTNPHADPAEDTLYRILSKNGCAPEWVELNKEIRCQISEWRLALKKAWMSKCNGDHSEWIEGSEILQVQLRHINNKMVETSCRRCDVHHGNYNPSRKAESNMQEDSYGPMTRARAKQLQRALTNQIAMIEAASELKISNQFEIGSRVLIYLQLELGDGKSP